MILFYQPLNPQIWLPAPAPQRDDASADKTGATR